MNIFTLFFGFILDNYGTLLCRAISTTALTVGLLFLMFAGEVHWFMFMGVILYAAGSFSLLLTNHPLAVLFPTVSGSILVIGQAVSAISISFFRVWSLMFSSGVQFRVCSRSYKLLHGSCWYIVH